MKGLSISIVCLLFLVSPLAGLAQSRVGLNYGVHVGWYSAGKNEAKMYIGRDYGVSSRTDLQYLLIDNETNYTKLKEYFNDDFSLYELPQNVAYKATLSIGGTLQYYTTETFAIFANAFFASPSLKNGTFSIKLKSKQGSLSNEVIEHGSITAKENRLNFEFGVHKAFKTKTNVLPYVETAVCASYLEVKSHEISIGNVKQNITYSNSQNSTTFSKCGYGGEITGGVQFPISDRFYLYSGISLTAYKFNIIGQTPFSLAKSIDFKLLL
ncbi:MAG: hypothetical protein J6V74_00295 [Bacteroidales bacterium]|nr:hypothetical protein [Bacteroidales bacterium]